MTALSVTSSFPDSDWDRRLDNMLEDLETSNGAVQQFSSQQQQQSSFSFSSSTSSQQSVMRSGSQQQQQMFSSQFQEASSRQVQQSGGLPQITHNQIAPFPNQPPANQFTGYSVKKSASSVSLKDSAGGVLKDLEDGLVKSSHYIQESHGKVVGPEGTREWHDVKRDDKPPEDFNLAMQVQHMMPSILSTNTSTVNNTRSAVNQQQQQQQYTAYKVQSNQYTTGGEPEEDDERPGSRLKQNIDELDTLLYDLNNARNLSPEGDGPEYPAVSENFGLDSDDYDETAGKEGHVKRTVHAFNEYSAHMSSVDNAKKPPSPSPRRKAPNSPPAVKRSPASQPPSRVQHSSSQSYQYQNMSHQHQQENHQVFQPAPGPPGSGQPFTYTNEPAPPAPSKSPDLSQPSYYTKYNSVKQVNTTTTTNNRTVPFPNQPTARSPTPQSPPKQIDELMSEFHEFDSVHKGGSPTPAMFFKPGNSTVEVTELPDEPPNQVRLDPTPVVREPTPPKADPAPAVPKGPQIYYPPGAEFSKAEPTPRPVADGGSMSLAEADGKGKAKASRARWERESGQEGDKQQGAAVIPICLPLCCAAPCVIL